MHPTLSKTVVQQRRKDKSAPRVRQPNSHSATPSPRAPYNCIYHSHPPLARQRFMPQPKARDSNQRVSQAIFFIIAATRRVMPSSDDGTGVAGDTGPQVGALLGDGAVDRGTCQHNNNKKCQAKTKKSAFYSRNATYQWQADCAQHQNQVIPGCHTMATCNSVCVSLVVTISTCMKMGEGGGGREGWLWTMGRIDRNVLPKAHGPAMLVCSKQCVELSSFLP